MSRLAKIASSQIGVAPQRKQEEACKLCTDLCLAACTIAPCRKSEEGTCQEEGIEHCEPQLGLLFFLQPQSERVRLCSAVVFDVLPSVDAVVEDCPSDGTDPQRQRRGADTSFQRGTRAEDSPVEGDTQHDLRSGDKPFGERIEGCHRQNGEDEQQQQDGVCRKREQGKQTRCANEEGEQDEQQSLAFRKIAFRQRTGSRSGGLFVDGAIPKVVPRAPRRARGDGGYGEEKGEQEGEQEGGERVSFPLEDNRQGEREPPPARHEQVEGTAERVEASETKIGRKTHGKGKVRLATLPARMGDVVAQEDLILP